MLKVNLFVCCFLKQAKQFCLLNQKGYALMSNEDNKRLALRWLDEVWNKGNMNLINELIAPEYVLHDPIRPGLQGRAAIQESIATFRQAFPDLNFTVEDQIAETDKVVTRYIVAGTHLGPLMGITATGKQGMITGIDVYRIENGQIAEAWSNWDTLGLLQRIGAIPSLG